MEVEGALFSGTSGSMGGLSNERELVEKCPVQFREENAWSAYANLLYYFGGATIAWQWKTADENEKRAQLMCLQLLVGSFDLMHEDKMAVAGWMLSCMLHDVPIHTPLAK